MDRMYAVFTSIAPASSPGEGRADAPLWSRTSVAESEWTRVAGACCHESGTLLVATNPASWMALGTGKQIRPWNTAGPGLPGEWTSYRIEPSSRSGTIGRGPV